MKEGPGDSVRPFFLSRSYDVEVRQSRKRRRKHGSSSEEHSPRGEAVADIFGRADGDEQPMHGGTLDECPQWVENGHRSAL